MKDTYEHIIHFIMNYETNMSRLFYKLYKFFWLSRFKF